MPKAEPAGRPRNPIWLQLHRYAGIAMTACLIIAAATGCLLSVETPLDALLNPDLFHPTASGQVDVVAALANLSRTDPGIVPIYVPLHAGSGRNIPVLLAARPGHPLVYDELFLDAGDGHVAGRRLQQPGWTRRGLMRGIYTLHFTLLAGTPGRWLVGLAAAIWFISNLVGLYLTIPARPPVWRGWLRQWRWRWSSPTLRLVLDLHRAPGLWLLLPLTILAATSAAMNFFDEATGPMIRHLSPAALSPFDGPPPAHPGVVSASWPTLIAAALQVAAHDHPGWRPAVLQDDPGRGLRGVRLTRSGLDSYRALGPITEWFGPGARFVYADDPYRDSAGQKLLRSLYPLHTGQMIGPVGVALDFILGLATLEMSGTGLFLWLKRRQPRR